MKKYIALMLILTLILPNAVMFTAFAEEEIIFITTGQEFVASVVESNFGKTFKIDGAEILSDGSMGIILPDNYTSVSGFFGTIEGVNGKNNIEMSKKSLFLTLGAGKTEISNIILKGATDDFTMSPTGNEKHFGVLISEIKEAAAIVVIKNVVNCVNITSPSRRLAAGGIVGFSKSADLTIENCINLGNITSSHDYVAAGGILGGSNGVADTGSITIKNCYNYGNITSSKSYVYNGGIYGGTYEYGSTTVDENNFTIINCGNYGKIYSSGSTSGYSGGIAALLYKANISKCFNTGEIVSGARYSGGIVGLVRSTTKHNTVISDCFNTGKVMGANTSTGSLTVTESPSGIASTYNGGNRDGVNVTGCYVIGTMGERPPVNTSTNKMYYSAVTNSKSESNNIQCIKADADDYIALEDLTATLPAKLSSDIWEYVSVENIDDEYKYPQLKGNTIWNDYKYYFTNGFVKLSGSDVKGEITNLSAGWVVEDAVKESSNMYQAEPAGYGISSLASWGSILGLTAIKGDMTGLSTDCSFNINKTAQIIIATDKNPAEETVNIVTDGGFTQMYSGDNIPATIVTKAGAVYYLSSKAMVVPDATPVTVTLGNSTGLNSSYALFINWIDNATFTFDLSGNENVYVNDELYSGLSCSVGKGAMVKIKVEPKENYYIKDFIVDGVSDKQNIATYYEKEILADKDMTIKVETASYEFIDDNPDDDATYPSYQLIQEIDSSTGMTVQSIRAEGYLGEFLEGATVTLNIYKEGLAVANATGTVNTQGKVQITVPMGNNEGECNLSFKLDVSGVVNDIIIDDSKKTYNIPSVADVNALISDLNNSSVTQNGLKALVLEEKETLPFNISVFKNLAPSIQDKIISDMVALNDYNVSNLYTRFDNFVVMNTLNMTSKSDDILKVFETYVLETGIDFSELYDDYLASNDKPGVCEGMLGVTYENAFDIISQFEYAVLKNELSKAVSYDKILNIIDTYDEILGIESIVAKAKGKNINEQKVINEEIGNNLKDLTTKDLFVAKLEYTVDNSKKILNDKTKPTVPQRPVISGGGGGGGGGGSSISVGNDYVETPDITPVEVGGTDSFVDLGDVKWANDSINKLFYKGILKGKEPGKFCPNDKVTRSEFVKMVVEAFKLEVENPSCDFKDLPKDHWAYKYVASASDIGIVSGYTSTEFGTDASISRQDVIAILIRVIYRMAKYEEMENRKNPDVSFTDESEIADYALGGVMMFAGSGIISGYEDGSFKPTQELTRAEAAVILNNVIEFFRI